MPDLSVGIFKKFNLPYTLSATFKEKKKKAKIPAEVKWIVFQCVIDKPKLSWTPQQR